MMKKIIMLSRRAWCWLCCDRTEQEKRAGAWVCKACGAVQP
jgi:hypothetical protein